MVHESIYLISAMKTQEDGGRKRRRLSEVSLQQEAPAQAVENGGDGGGPKKMLLAPPKPSVCRCLHLYVFRDEEAAAPSSICQNCAAQATVSSKVKAAQPRSPARQKG